MQIELIPDTAIPAKGVLVAVQMASTFSWSALAATDMAQGGKLGRLISTAGFEGKPGEVLSIPAPVGTGLTRLILVGAAAQSTPAARRELGAKIAVLPEVLAADEIALHAPAGIEDILRGMALRAYSFDTYRKPQLVLKNVDVLVGENACTPDLSALAAEVGAVHFARDLVNEPANVLTPLEMARRIAEAGKATGVQVQIIERDELDTLGFRLLLGVGQGSSNPPCVVVMRIGEGMTPPVALVGKGVCFDTGGVHIKPVANMWEMKGDMGGAAAAAGAMLALAKTGYDGDAVAVLGLAENMTGGNAIRPGDIIRSYSGQTVEVRNTDCEGRLILADCLSYAQRALRARKVIDIATLTYAVQIGLGTRYAGLYGNAPQLVAAVQRAAAMACEKVWPMPIDEEFHGELKSDFADMLNWPGVIYGNASIAAAFLDKFIDEGTDWVHVDIAGPSYAAGGTVLSPPGGTGFAVETLVNLLREHA